MEFMVAFKKVFSNRPFMGAVLFLVFINVFEELLFDFPQVRFFQLVTTHRPPEEVWIALASGIGSLVISFLIVRSALVSTREFQIVYIFLVGLALIVQYGFWNALGRFLSTSDLQIAAATPLNMWQGAGTLYVDWRFVIPLLGFVVLIFVFSRRRTWKLSLLFLGSSILLIILLSFIYSFTDKKLSLGTSLPSFYQTVGRFLLERLSPADREMVSYRSATVPANNIVLIVDESIRGDHLDINGYSRPTTPYLNSLLATEQYVHNFGVSVAGATCSYPSNALILTGVQPGSDDFELTKYYPTVFQYAKAMGYKTYYMDAQTNSLWNGLTDSDMRFIDVWLRKKNLGDDIQSDFRAADRISEIVAASRGNFIVLNKRGVHFLYENSYPKEMTVWPPLPGNYANNPDSVKNYYDNGIRYNVNMFFERLLANSRVLDDTVILYTSDHGQTLFEDGASWLHCNYTPQEAMVPLILIGRNLPTAKAGYVASHSNILPTLLDLMNVPGEARLHGYAPSLFTATPEMNKEHFFFDGALRLISLPAPLK